MLEVRNGEIAEFRGKTLKLTSGDVLEADLVVFGTGFRQDYSIFPNDLRDKLELEEDGLYLYRYILPAKIDNLAFIGKVAAVSNISSYGLQAEWLARKIVTHALPPQEERAAEIAVRKQWARSWMPKTSGRASLVLLHQTHYHDQLLRDIGERPLRKSNLLSEYLMPYVSQDYNGIVGMPLK
jgi:dimethylaniline monooxygenase (N-oxide forming)